MNITTDTSIRSSLSRAFLAVTGVILAAVISGCAYEPSSHVVSAPPPAPPAAVTTATTTTPVVVTSGATSTPVTSTATTVAPGTVVVTQAPPAVQQETVLARPSAQHVWVPGYYTWRDNRYVWIAGRWEIPPRTDAVWVAPRWERESGGYRFYEGYWQ